MSADFEETGLPPTLLLLSEDKELSSLVREIVKRPWKLVRRSAHEYMIHQAFSQPNVRLVILDDQTVEQGECLSLLAQIRRHFSGDPLLYVACNQTDDNEKRARTNGAHYYESKPISPERFGRVLQSFLRAQHLDGQSTQSSNEKAATITRESGAGNQVRFDGRSHDLWEELNREDSKLRSQLLDAALAGLRLANRPESLELRRDAARIWVALEPSVSNSIDGGKSLVIQRKERQRHISFDLARRVSRYHDQLQKTLREIVENGTEQCTEAKAREAGRALSRLSIFLDEVIENKERKLLPRIEKVFHKIGRND